jgi:predicted dehydrogenase/threonine dehydrogenase-like Zn-dependent dehydrogenase
MRQVVQSYRTGELWLADVPTPALRGGGVLVRTAASLVSAGTERAVVELAGMSLLGKARARPDLVKKVLARIKAEGLLSTAESVFKKLDTVIPLGYSCAGIVVEVGPGVTGIKPGDRVACGGAGYATHAEVNYVPRNLTVRIPESLAFDEASFATLGAIAMQGVRQADVRIGDRIAVIGLGLLGSLSVQILKAAGCRVLGSDLDPGRCELGKRLGADAVAAGDLAGAAAAFSDGQGVDAVIITAATTSNGPIEEAAEISRPKGRVVVVGMVGMAVPREPFYRKELELRLSLSYGPGRYDPGYEEEGHDYPFPYVRWTEQRNMASFLELVAARKVTPAPLVSHRFPISEALDAYELLKSRTMSCLGIVLEYPTPAEDARHGTTIELAPMNGARAAAVGFVGAGNFAKDVLLPQLSRRGDVQLVGICTATGISASETGKKHGFGYATTDRQRLLSDRHINTVFIVTRHDTHATLVREALLSGKHVFVEKPLCLNREELAMIERTVEASPGRCLMVGFNRRFSPHTLAIRQAFADRHTPMVISYRVNAGIVPKESWIHDLVVGGGRIVGEVCHFVDWCESVVGSEPLRVQAASITSDDVRLASDDSLVITIEYRDGSLAAIQYVALGPGELGKERVEVFADGRAAILDDFVNTTFHGVRQSAVRTRRDKGISGELSAFLRAVRGESGPPIPFASIARTTRVTFAIVESLRGGRPVSADADPEPRT